MSSRHLNRPAASVSCGSKRPAASVACNSSRRRRKMADAAAAAAATRDSSSWASLHEDLVSLIGWRVLAGDLRDYIRFRAACAHSVQHHLPARTGHRRPALPPAAVDAVPRGPRPLPGPRQTRWVRPLLQPLNWCLRPCPAPALQGSLRPRLRRRHPPAAEGSGHRHLSPPSFHWRHCGVPTSGNPPAICGPMVAGKQVGFISEISLLPASVWVQMESSK